MTDAFGKRGQKKIASVVENVLPDYATVVSSSSMLPYFYNQVTCVASAERGGKGAEYSQARGDGGGGSRILAREYFFPFRSPFCACHTRYISGNFNNLVT